MASDYYIIKESRNRFKDWTKKERRRVKKILDNLNKWYEDLNMATDYNSIIPNKILFNLKEIEEIGLIKTDMAKKLVYNGYLEVVKIGNKIHISREELINYLESNTYSSNKIA